MKFISTIICCSLIISLVTATKLPYNPKKGGTTTGDTVVIVPVPGVGPSIGRPHLPCSRHHVECLPGKTFNHKTCQCECKAVCNQFQVLNEAICRCQPKHNHNGNNHNHNHNHNGNYIYNGYYTNGYYTNGGYINGGQRCPNYYQCQSPRILNPATCQCQCPPRQCPAGQFQDPTSCQCTCRRDIACPRGQIRDPFSCRCECERRGCPFPQIMNQDTCECECSRRFCPQPRFLNPSTCQCECSSSSRSCDLSRQRFNPNTCECDCNLVSVTVEVPVPGIPVQPPSQLIRRYSRTPGGRKTGPGYYDYVNGANGFINGQYVNGGYVNGGFFAGKRKRRALSVDKIDKKRHRRSHSRSRSRSFVFVPPQPIPSPPSFRTETRLIPGPCPAGTTLIRSTCSCR